MELTETGFLPNKEDSARLSTIVAIGLIIVLGFAVYANSLNGQFLLDDEQLVKNNIYIKHWSNISKIFTKNIRAGAGETSLFYRPLQMITYMIDYSIWRLNVNGYHLTNISIHISAALAIYWLINILFGERLLSLFTSLLFVVYPIHSNTVAYISGRADPLALLFMLLCFIFYIKYLQLEKLSLYIFMSLSYILALLSRENSLILPLLLLLYHFTFSKPLRIRAFSSILGINFMYILLRLTLLRDLLPGGPGIDSLSQRTPGFFVAIANYIRLLFLPFNLHMEYGNALFSLTNPRAILGILLLTSLLIYALRKRRANNLIFFSISWFFIALIPVSNLYHINAYMAEHWLYLPSIGFFLILAKGLSHIYRYKNFKAITVVFVICILAFYSSLTIRHAGYWNNPIAFYEQTLKYTPDSPIANNNLANLYRDIGRNREAIVLLRRAIEVCPDCVDAYNNLGLTYQNTGEDEKAIAFFEEAVRINPTYAKVYNNLGLAYTGIGKNEEAINSFKKAIEINPIFVGAYSNLGLAYDSIGKGDEAIDLYKQAIKLDPDFALAYHNLSVTYFRKKQYQLAIEYCDKARKLGFTNPAFLELLEPYRE